MRCWKQLCWTFPCLLCALPASAQEVDRAAAAQAYGKARSAVTARPDGLIICEGEEFQPQSTGGWQAKPWGENYYAATFANCFLSRKAFLGAPQQCKAAAAKIRVQVPKAGKYLVLVRYEAAYRFETQFRVQLEQQGRQLLDRRYGARDNLKIWAFGQKLKKEVGWSWGAGENLVWEGHDVMVDLQPGPATITLVADKQPEPAARRNVDLVMLTTDVEEVNKRIEKERYLPLDGLLTQSGDVWLKVTNRGDQPLTFKGKGAPGGGNWQQHSPYWVHLRNWNVPSLTVPPGQTSEWTEVGGTMDSLNDGRWFWTGNGKYQAEFGLKGPTGKIETIATFQGEGDLTLAADADMRYSRRLRRQEQVLFDLLKYLRDANPATHGKTPSQTTIYASTFSPLAGKHADAVGEFKRMFALSDTSADAPGGRGYIDVRSVPTAKLAEHCQKLGANAGNVAVVSLGDEIGLPKPRGKTVNDDFRAWLQAQKLRPADVLPSAGNDWQKIAYAVDADTREQSPGVYYWSMRYLYHFGIQAIKVRTDILREHLPKAAVGANYSPHYPVDHLYLGEVHKWVSIFRQGGMTLPWSEDYIWQVPVGSPQMNNINLDLFRAGLRGNAGGKIHYYVMPHAPNNTPQQWRRLFYGALGHGMKIVNLFEFRPVYVAYTENHVNDPAMYAMVLKSFRELGLFEDVVQAGQLRPAQAALWFSETADIWGDNHGSFAAGKRSLYTAIRHQQIPLDFVVEPDALDGTLAQYRVLYLSDAHVSQAASGKIAAWVKQGGTLFATAGAGMFDELNRPNEVLRPLLGVEQTALEVPQDRQITWIKQDLPFATKLATVTWNRRGESRAMPVFGVRSRLKLAGAAAEAQFDDGSPAITSRRVGQGRAIHCGFLPGLAYYHPAVPLKPVDRGATNDAMVHFLPTQFDAAAADLIALPGADLTRPVECNQPLVESTVIQSKSGVVIPLVNWTPQPVQNLQVTVRISAPGKQAALASGKALQSKPVDGGRVFTFDLDVADALILR